MPIKNQAPASQAERFAEAARALGADESEAAFREKLAMIARHKPESEPAPAEKKDEK